MKPESLLKYTCYKALPDNEIYNGALTLHKISYGESFKNSPTLIPFIVSQ